MFDIVTMLIGKGKKVGSEPAMPPPPADSQPHVLGDLLTMEDMTAPAGGQLTEFTTTKLFHCDKCGKENISVGSVVFGNRDEAEH